jgi:hypothetical protein
VRVASAVTGVGLATLLAACGGASTPGSTTAGSPGPVASSPAGSSAVPPASSPATSVAPGGADSGQCKVTVQELEAATKLTWKLGKTLPERPLEYDKSLKASTCAFIAEAKAVRDDFGDPLTLRIDVATGANAKALETSTLEGCGEGIPPGKLRAPRGGGGGKVCDSSGSVTEALVVKDGSTLSFTVFSNSEKILKTFSPAFEDAIAAIAG